MLFPISTNLFLRSSKLLLYLVGISVLVSCGPYSAIEFKSVENVKVSAVQGSLVTLEGIALFHNPNSIGAKLKKTDIDVFLDGELLTKLEPAGKIKIKRNNDFEIPIKATLDVAKGGTMNSLLQMFLKNEKEIRLKGYITLQVLLYKENIDIDYSFPVVF